MRKSLAAVLFVLVLGVGFSVEVSAATSIPSLQTLALYKILEHRCYQYVPPYSSSALTQGCRRASWKMVEGMDLKYARAGKEKKIEGILVYPQDLQRLLRDPKAIRYLETIDQIPWSTSLWTWTLQQAGGNPAQALEWIALFFQDSVFGAHIRYLELLYGDRMGKQIEVLRQANEFIRVSSQLNFYPEGIESKDPAQYHFYVIAYMAYRISQSAQIRGAGIDRGMAPWIPQLLNVTYEFVMELCLEARKNAPTAPESLGQLAGPASGSWLKWLNCWHPKTYERNLHEGSLSNIYLGYAGALFGAGRFTERMSFDDFLARFPADPQGWLRSQAPRSKPRSSVYRRIP